MVRLHESAGERSGSPRNSAALATLFAAIFEKASCTIVSPCAGRHLMV